MPAPRLEIELGKIAHNARELKALYDSKGVRITAVTKGVCGSPRVAGALLKRGNSANYQWFVSTPDTGQVNHLRIGESILLGCDSLTRKPIPGLHTDAFTLVGEVIELKTKPSKLYCEIAQDAFGHVPTFDEMKC
jgi:predicted amino acid racemase